MKAICRSVFVIVWTISLSLSGETEGVRQLNISVDNVTPQVRRWSIRSVRAAVGPEIESDGCVYVSTTCVSCAKDVGVSMLERENFTSPL